jgi:4-alpha-glucanotransferase
MRQLGLLSLEIQRMPKDPKRTFFHPADAPYLSVVTPSTHDMSTIRGWWEEDRDLSQQFFNDELGQWVPHHISAMHGLINSSLCNIFIPINVEHLPVAGYSWNKQEYTSP